MAGCSSGPNPIEGVPITDTVKNTALGGNVDVVRDEWGIPHVYGGSPGDVAFAQGYVMAMDRLIQMDLARRQADGTLSELLGDADPAVIDIDIQMRVHHMRGTVTQAWQTMLSSHDPADEVTVTMLTKFAAGVNAYVADLKNQKYDQPAALAFIYNPQTFRNWTEIDSLLLGQLQAFTLSFDADSDITRTQIDAAAKMVFDDSTDPAHLARKGIAADLELMLPVDPTYTLPGVDQWTGMGGDSSRAAREIDPALLPVLAAAKRSVHGIGHDAQTFPTVGSNNWVVGPGLTQNGHVLVANDTHLSLGNPPTFYLMQLKSTGSQKLDVMGVQFPGIPGIILGMNEHIAWGSTVNYIDVTDVYQETIVTCDDGVNPCVLYKGGKVALQPRLETINIGRFGDIIGSKTVKLYDVPHHGPIIPRITADHQTEALAGSELSIRYTGYEPAPKLASTIYGIDSASNVKEAEAAVDAGFLYGNQNWVIGDDQGHIGWTQFTRTPRRSVAAPPWKVLPGDGSAEWGADMDPRYIPHAYDPAQGFLATANNDPIGVTDDNDPFFAEPMVDGLPLYLGSDYDPGTRVGRITKRIQAATANGGKLAFDDMQSIQADAVTEWAPIFMPTLLDAAQAAVDENNMPGTHPDIAQLVAMADAPSKGLLNPALNILKQWSSYDTPSATDAEQPTQQQIQDSQAATIFNLWLRQFADRAIGDETGEAINITPSAFAQLRLLTVMVQHPEKLKTGVNTNGEALLFSDAGSTDIITKRHIAAAALFDVLDFLFPSSSLGSDPAQWRWGKLHTLTLQFLAPVDALQIPLKNDAQFPSGFPRHGDIGTVDAAGDTLDAGNFTYDHGPAIRFSCELDPKKGPTARNVLPGGEILDPKSPHYRDQLELWRKNQAIDLSFTDAQVAASAKTEQKTNGLGRIHFSPH